MKLTVTYPGRPGRSLNFPPLAAIADGAYTGWKERVNYRALKRNYP